MASATGGCKVVVEVVRSDTECSDGVERTLEVRVKDPHAAPRAKIAVARTVSSIKSAPGALSLSNIGRKQACEATRYSYCSCDRAIMA